MSGHHLTLFCEEGSLHLEDGADGRPSTNGTFLNGKRVAKGLVRSGDVIDLNHIRLTVKNAELFFENVGDSLSFRASQDAAVPVGDRKAPLKYRRSPRTRERLPQNEIVLARPPARGSRFEKRKGLFTSLLSGGAMLGASVAMGAASPALLAARAASLISPVTGAAMGHSSNKKGQKAYEEYVKARQEKYGAYIESQKALIGQVADKQREIISRENPAPEECARTVQELRRTLWERSPYDQDFLEVRVGMGYEPLCVPVKTPMDMGGFQMEEDEAEELMKGIVEETRIVDRVPARVRLGQYGTVGVIGRRENVVPLVRNMLLALCTSHYYEDVRLVGLFDEEEKALWEPLRFLPHIWDSDGQSRFLAFGQADAGRLSDMFHDILRGRLEAAAGPQRGGHRGPHYVFVFGSQRLSERCMMMQELLTNDPSLGATALFAYNLYAMPPEEQLRYLPHQCQFIIDTDERFGSCAYDKAETNGKFMFQPDAALPEDSFDLCCRTMSAIEVEGSSRQMQLPGGITFLQGMGASHVRDLDAWARWTRPHKPGSLAAPMAVTADGKPFSLDIGNENEPPVVLVAGMAGSGKSEFLAAWLLSMSLCYHPHEMSFVVIDFKGGALANSLQGLPHMVGKITDLKNDVQRTITSLMFEIRRREMLFEKEHVQKLSEYTRGPGQYGEPLPYLLIVCDEFAELKQQQPEIAKGLDSVARLGRSVGVRLICAMQNPMGVVNDELRANSCCQVCLKVQNTAASKDMILRPDAAMLTQNGRAYVRVGADVVFEQVQSYWSGAPYLGDDQAASAGNQVRIVQTNGQRIKTVYEEKTRFRSDETELQVVSAYLSRTAREHNLEKMPCPWLPELPQKLFLDELEVPGGFGPQGWEGSLPWLLVPVGRYDKPQAQEQGVQALNLEAQGHYGLYGASGTGKTTLLKTILLSLGTWYTPEDVNIYILDLGSWSLKAFEGMPHVGGVALGNEEEKFGKLAVMLKDLLEERKQLFSRYGLNSLKAYRETVAGDKPAVVLAIDNITPIFDLYPAYEGLLQQISSEGASYGIYVIFTANSTTGIKYKFLQNIRGAVAFEMNDKSDYPSTVGRVENPAAVAGCKGRAFFKGSGGPVVFQAALYGRGDTEMEQINSLKETLGRMGQSWGGQAVSQLKSMPERVGMEDLLPYCGRRELLPVGLLDPDVEPAYLDFSAGCCAMVVGSTGGGKSAMLCKIAELLAKGQEDWRIYVVDSTRRSLEPLREHTAGYALCKDGPDVNRMLKGIVQELAGREAARKQAQAAPGFDPAAFESGYFPICLLVDDMGDFIEWAQDEEQKLLRILCKNGHGLGLVCIAAGRAGDLSRLSSLDPLTIHMLSSGQALAVSGCASDYMFLPNDLGFEARSAKLDASHGLLYSGGLCRKVKLVQ